MINIINIFNLKSMIVYARRDHTMDALSLPFMQNVHYNTSKKKEEVNTQWIEIDKSISSSPRHITCI